MLTQLCLHATAVLRATATALLPLDICTLRTGVLLVRPADTYAYHTEQTAAGECEWEAWKTN